MEELMAVEAEFLLTICPFLGVTKMDDVEKVKSGFIRAVKGQSNIRKTGNKYSTAAQSINQFIHGQIQQIRSLSDNPVKSDHIDSNFDDADMNFILGIPLVDLNHPAFEEYFTPTLPAPVENPYQPEEASAGLVFLYLYPGA
ncbi:hypothetical protein E6O75_ATG08737 [Venturia nashicola]|uniref:Uncharacterized protein n=1 Tax=Venturia nashicola TaxID=86259 RepID=A0A4Z1NV15_9PEZI|nr:hypothetical protein E6O75_ATG08737 [Venturia nashicola]